MNAVVYCLTVQHDLRFVVLAGLVSLLSTAVGYDLLSRARVERGYSWFYAATFVTGSGIWATHFIAMLAYNPGVPIAFELTTTALSALAGIAIGGIGFAILLYTRQHRRVMVPLAGAIIGGGVAVLHYLGMAAARIAAGMAWDWSLVVWSIGLGCVLGAGSTVLFDRARTRRQRMVAALVLTLAVCAHHFTAMGAILIDESNPASVASGDLSKVWLAVSIAAAMILILSLAVLGGTFDGMLTSQAQREARRYSALANAAVEGIVICRDGVIVDANDSFCKLVGRPIEALRGTPFADTVATSAQYDITALFSQNISRSVSVDLRTEDGADVPVDVLRRVSGADDRDVVILAVRDLRERRDAESRIRFLAHHDALTGLANRTFFGMRVEDEIARAERTGRKVGFHYVDLDRFKRINDTFGHAGGDDVLREAARRLESVASSGSVVARLGGDEFAVVQMDVQSSNDLADFAEAICRVMAKPMRGSDGRTIALSASIGVAVYPDDGRDLDALAHSADVALYRAKEGGRSGFRIFEREMESELRERRELQTDLALAIAEGRIEVVYQPQVRITDRVITGFEALARWTHPERGPIAPSVFVPLAERDGSILQLGELMLRKACADAAAWEAPLKVSVNLSPVQITHGNLPDLITRILLETGLAPSRLELEVTEGVLITDMERAVHVLRRVKALGVTIAMDDFGTGYSSLHYLQSFPFDKLKIDRSFVQNIGQNAHSRAIVRAIIGLGGALGLPVVAEGVETQAQLDLLDREDCEQVQGFFTGKPQPIEAFSGLTAGDAAMRKAG